MLEVRKRLTTSERIATMHLYQVSIVQVWLTMTTNEILQSLSQFQRIKQNEYEILKLGVFGSAARGEMAADSDVDVVVELAIPDLLTLVGIKQDLEEMLERPVDVIRYRETMNAFLKQRIDQEAIYV